MNTSMEDEQSWDAWSKCWKIRPDTIYLNHGSFGPPPTVVRHAREAYQRRLESNPMDFLVRELEGEIANVRDVVADFIGTRPENLALVDNATYGMNVVATSFPLSPGDEVLLTNHEYGAVRRIWNRQCEVADCQLQTVDLPESIESADQVVDAITNAVTQRTKLLVVSHITSATAITLPVRQIIERVRTLGVAVCIDGPHAVAQLPLNIDELGCDFYTASCHKWLSAPLGTGFLYVSPRWHEMIQPPILSWGKTESEEQASWTDEFGWLGTRDPSALLAIPSAIALLKRVGLENFRRRTHQLASYARERLAQFDPRQPIVPDSPQWYGAMAHVPLPAGDARQLQMALWGQFGIEVPIIDFAGRRWIRVSCHLYNKPANIDRLAEALHVLL